MGALAQWVGEEAWFRRQGGTKRGSRLVPYMDLYTLEDVCCFPLEPSPPHPLTPQACATWRRHGRWVRARTPLLSTRTT